MNGRAIGIEIGGSHVQCGVVEGAQVLISETIAVDRTVLKAVLPRVVEAVTSMTRRNKHELSTMTGVAVGICAVVDRTNRVAATNGKYEDSVGFDFGQWAMKEFGLLCVAENDTRLALLGEQFAGAAAGADDVALITLGTGIGGAVMLNGKLLQSSGGKAGGLAGHLGVDWQGRMCSCGNRGCAEAEASTAALDSICREHSGFAQSALVGVPDKIDFKKLFEAVDGGDRLAQQVLHRCIGVWSALAVSMIHAYDPGMLVFGGGLMLRQEAILPKIRAHVERHAWIAKDSVKIVCTALHSSAALLGAMPLLQGRA